MSIAFELSSHKNIAAPPFPIDKLVLVVSASIGGPRTLAGSASTIPLSRMHGSGFVALPCLF